MTLKVAPRHDLPPFVLQSILHQSIRSGIHHGRGRRTRLAANHRSERSVHRQCGRSGERHGPLRRSRTLIRSILRWHRKSLHTHREIRVCKRWWLHRNRFSSLPERRYSKASGHCCSCHHHPCRPPCPRLQHRQCSTGMNRATVVHALHVHLLHHHGILMRLHPLVIQALMNHGRIHNELRGPRFRIRVETEHIPDPRGDKCAWQDAFPRG